MAAEWILQTYTYDPKELVEIVGCGNVALAKKIAAAAKELHEDDRIDGSLEDIVVEIVQKKLKRAHAMSYRIALEAIMNRIGKRVVPRVTTYALKPDVGRVLGRLGQKTLASAWNKPRLSFPTPALARATDWPMATSLDAASMKKAALEAKTLPKNLETAVVPYMTEDPDFATDVADVIEVLGRVAKKTTGALMILVDGEQ